jgi:hypothetical protein
MYKFLLNTTQAGPRCRDGARPATISQTEAA